jgi:signal transduction histidine kinase
LLEGASIETGRFRVFVQPTDLPAIIQETVQAISPLAAKYGIEIETEIPAWHPAGPGRPAPDGTGVGEFALQCDQVGLQRGLDHHHRR